MASQSPVVKYHFWFLFFSTPLFIGLAFLLMLVFVGITLADAQKEFDATKAGLNAQPKTKGELDAMAAQVGTLETDRNTLWKTSYEEQSEDGVFRWPVSSTAAFNDLAPKRDPDGKVVSEMKFGDKFNLQNRVTTPEVLRPTFERAYADLEKGNPRTGEKGIAPTRFAGGPGAAGSYLNALRSVTSWTPIALDPEPFWLMLEDYWVQRGLLAPIAQVNAEAAVFQPVTTSGKEGDLKGTFRTRTWELDLQVEQKGAKQFLKGELRNRTARLQPLGVNKAMRVQVWFKEPARLTELKKSKEPKDLKAAARFDWPTPDVVYEIRGESVPGKAALACSPQEFVTASEVSQFARVVQVFDEATVPVRLVNTIELGMLDHRHKADPFEMPKHMDGYEWTDTSGGTTGGGPGAPGGPPGGSLSGAGVGSSGGSPPGGLPGGSPSGSGDEGESTAAAATAPTGKKFGIPKVVLFDNRMRYVKRTDDVRRMPVAVSVVIDHDYTNDLMVAYTNSPLHFQITQTQWARFKGTLPPVSGGIAPPPVSGGTLDGERGGLGTPDGGSPGMPPGAPGFPAASGGSAGTLPGEAAANLCEFALFGVVSLYEKLPEAKEEEKKDGDPMTTPDPMPKPDEKKPEGEKKDPPPADAPKPPATTPPADEKKDKQPDPTTPGK